MSLESAEPARDTAADSDPGPGSSVRPSPEARAIGGVPRREWLILATMTVAYATLIVYLTNLRFEAFYGSNWDLGINQQLLWTGAHGRLLYESADLEFYNAHSFLQVHSTYIAFAVVPLYAVAPSPLTLFIVQAVVFAASSVPLYLFAREVLRRPWLSLAVVALYLGSFGVVSALAYDFHWESFLPLELLTFFLLVRKERYWLSLIPLAIGTMTLEVFPFLAGGVALYFLVDRFSLQRWDLRRLLHDSRARWLVGVLALGLAAYLTVRLFQYVVIPTALGAPSTTGGGPSGLASTVGWSANGITLPHSIAYWLLLLASLGFLPILAPRYLILSIPWFVYSVFVAPVFSAHFGDAYAFIAMAPLTLAAAAGLANLVKRRDPSGSTFFLLIAQVLSSLLLTAIAGVSGGSAHILGNTAGAAFWAPALALFALAVGLSAWLRKSHPTVSARPISRLRRNVTLRRAILPALAALFVTILVFDAIMSPMNPANFGATPIPGYQFGWAPNPMSAQMSWIEGRIPAGAEILASDHLFPFVANDPNAWALPWFVMSSSKPVPYFPFNATHLPHFVLVDDFEMGLVPSFLAADLFNVSIYGLVAYAYMTAYPGTVYLFEQGYHTPPLAHIVVPPQNPSFFGAANLTTGSAGVTRPDPGSAFGRVIASQPVGPVTGTMSFVWGGPYDPVLPGAYRVTFNVSAESTNANSTTPFAEVDVVWTGGTAQHLLYQVKLSSSTPSTLIWSNIEFGLNLTQPYPLVEFRGVLLLENGHSIGSLTLNYVEVQRL